MGVIRNLSCGEALIYQLQFRKGTSEYGGVAAAISECIDGKNAVIKKDSGTEESERN